MWKKRQISGEWRKGLIIQIHKTRRLKTNAKITDELHFLATV
jgi:hypothetical protein